MPQYHPSNRRFKIVELDTTGWNHIPEAVNLTKEQCDNKLQEYIRNGATPNTLKVVLNDDPKYAEDQSGNVQSTDDSGVVKPS